MDFLGKSGSKQQVKNLIVTALLAADLKSMKTDRMLNKRGTIEDVNNINNVLIGRGKLANGYRIQRRVVDKLFDEEELPF